MSIKDRREELSRALDAFLANPLTTQRHIDDLSTFLRARPNVAPVHDTLVDEIEERLLLCPHITGESKSWRAIDVAILMAIPLSVLRETASDPDRRIRFSDIELFVRRVLRMRLDEVDGEEFEAPIPGRCTTSGPSNNPSSAPDNGDEPRHSFPSEPQPPMRTRPMLRDEDERSKCFGRDGTGCIFTRTALPEAFHIVPFGINWNERRLYELSRCADFTYLLSGGDMSRGPLLTGGVCRSDKAWNMLSLNLDLHTWWALGYFGLKYLGITPAESGDDVTIRLQFHWMPRRAEHRKDAAERGTEPHWTRKVDLSEEASKMVRDWKERECYGSLDPVLTGGWVRALDADGRPISSGRVAEVRMPRGDAEGMRAMVELQWACIRIAGMAGAMGCRDFLEESKEALDARMREAAKE